MHRPGRAAPAERRHKVVLKKRKFLFAGLVLIVAFAFLGYQAFISAATYYLTGGTAQAGTIVYENKSRMLRFTVTDGTESLSVLYQGVVPDSFKPDAEVVLEGQYGEDGTFQATTLLAKCPSKYTPG